MSYQSKYSGGEVDESVLNYLCSRVNTLDELNALDTSKLKDGWKCYVISIDTEYIWKGSKWNKISYQNTLIKENDTTLPSDDNAYSSKRSRKEFISKASDDTTPYNLGIGKNLNVGKDQIVGGDSYIKGDQIISGNIISPNYNENTQSGFAIEKKDTNHYKISITDLEIWGKAIFNSLEVRRLVSVGGNYMFSPANGTILTVQEFETYYRCYLLADDGTTATENGFNINDNVLCQTFNIKEGVYENVSNKRYWRTVTGVSSASEILYDKGIVSDQEGNPITYISESPLYEGKKFYYIDLSKTLCESGSDIPSAGDEIATFGNTTDADRQNAIYITSAGDGAPAIKLYAGINSFDLTGKMPIIISPDKFEVLSSLFKLRTSNGGTVTIPNFKGNWVTGTTAYYNEQYSYEGKLWICINTSSSGISTAPILGPDWNIIVDKGEKGDTGNDGIAGKDGVGISSTTVTYQIGDSGTTAPTGTWTSTVPTAVPGKYLWTRTVWTYTDSTSETGYSVSKYGEKGDTGSSPYLLDLTNENSSVTCDKSGNVIGILQGTTAKLYYGSTAVNDVVYSAQFDGCTGDINSSTGVVTMTGLTQNTGTVTIIATHASGYLTAIYTITKVYAGADGSNAVTYYIIPSANAIQKDNDTLTPSTITCSKYKQIGGQTPVITTEKILKYQQSTDSTETVYSTSISVSTDATYVDFILYDTNGTTILDKERVPIVSNGLSIASVDVEYAKNQSSTIAPTTGWQTTAPTWQNGYYIWTRTTIRLSDGSENTTDPVCITGGKGISSIIEYYYLSSSSTSLIGGSWQTTAPTWQNGYYIWTKSVITYTDSTTSETTPICVTGEKGNNGLDGNDGIGAYNVVLSNSSIIFTQALDKSIDYNIVGNKVYFSIYYQGIKGIINVATITSKTNCEASIYQDTDGFYLKVTSINVDINNNYYNQGNIVINVGISGVHTEIMQVNWALNALGTFYEEIINDTDGRYASKTEFNTLSDNSVTKTELSSAIEQSASEINLSVNAVTTKISEFGGSNQNLLRGSKLLDIDAAYTGTLKKNDLFDFTSVYNIYSGNYIDVLRWDNKVNIKKNTYYTLSMYIKGTGSIGTFLYPDCCAQVINSDGFSGNGSDGYNTFNYDLSNFKKVWVTWLTNSTTQGYKSLIAARLNSGNITICGVKLEEGSISTKWSPYEVIEGNNYIDNPTSPTLSNGTLTIVNDSERGNVADISNNTSQDFQLIYKSNNLDEINISDNDITFFAIIKDINGSSSWAFGGWFNWDNFNVINNGTKGITNISKIKYVAKGNSQTIISKYNSTDKTYTILTTITNSSSDEGVTKTYILSTPLSLSSVEYIAIMGGVKIGNYDSENIIIANKTYKNMASAIAIYDSNDLTLYNSLGVLNQDYGTYGFLNYNSPYIELGGGWRKYYNSFKCQGNIWDKSSGLGLNSLNGELRIYSVGIVKGDSAPSWEVDTIEQKLLATGILIKDKKIVATTDSFVIRDNSGNVNTVFKDVGGVPMLDANLIQADTITARRLKTKSTGANTEIVSDTMSQYNDSGELRTLVHGGTLGGANSVVNNLFSVPVGVLNRTIYATNGLQQVFDIKLSASSFQIISLANVIKLLDAYENNNVPITCNITCNNVSAIGTELYISGIPGQNCNDAFIWSETPTTGALNITEGMSGTVVLSSKVAQTGCDLYLRLKVVFTNSSGSLSINNTNLNSNGDADKLLAQVTYGGDRTEMAGDGFMSIFGNYGIKITSSGIQKTTDGGETWSQI